ncbi:DMT family transporter [Actinomycetospora termitidis]|uniref:SMR family transporter n=1 Tax=Actinomycetospora termitidis TaxID=3053470 RepID=A0ABT7MIP5_9PSEU|nr:SMR family transporter [Actinomycetospora sp. Odt1-22]MDL5159837.1 SMR family transporter [Actinomycetospora sp. Odt1-22]
MTGTLLLLGSVLAQGLAIAATRASEGLRRFSWVAVAFAGMAVSVMLMSQAIARGLPLAVGYGIWSGSGIVLAATAGVLVFGDRLDRRHVVGLLLVLVGVVVVYGGAG